MPLVKISTARSSASRSTTGDRRRPRAGRRAAPRPATSPPSLAMTCSSAGRRDAVEAGRPSPCAVGPDDRRPGRRWRPARARPRAPGCVGLSGHGDAARRRARRGRTTTKYQLLAATMPTRSPGSRPRPTQPAAQAGRPARAARRRWWTCPGEISATASSGCGSMIVARFTAGSPAQAGARRRADGRAAGSRPGRYRPDHHGDARSPSPALPVAGSPLLLPGRAGRAGRPPARRTPSRPAADDAGRRGRRRCRARSRSSSSRINSLRASKGLRQLQVSGELVGHRPALDRPDGRRPGRSRHNPNLGIAGRRRLDEARRERRRRLRRRRADAGLHQQPRPLRATSSTPRGRTSASA